MDIVSSWKNYPLEKSLYRNKVGCNNRSIGGDEPTSKGHSDNVIDVICINCSKRFTSTRAVSMEENMPKFKLRTFASVERKAMMTGGSSQR